MYLYISLKYHLVLILPTSSTRIFVPEVYRGKATDVRQLPSEAELDDSMCEAAEDGDFMVISIGKP